MVKRYWILRRCLDIYENPGSEDGSENEYDDEHGLQESTSSFFQ